MATIKFLLFFFIIVLLNISTPINGDDTDVQPPNEEKHSTQVVTVSPDKITVYATNDVLLYCNYYNSNSSTPVEITWIHQQKDLDLASDTLHYKVDKVPQDGLILGMENTMSQYLLITNLVPSDAGEYKCKVKSDDETISISQNTINMTILEPEAKAQTEEA